MDHRRMVEEGLELLDQAGREGADIACLPECFNLLGRPDPDWLDPPPSGEEPLCARVRELAGRHRMHVILPVVERRGDARYNTALLIDRNGEFTGRYDKTHLTGEERNRYGLTPGDTYPVFELDFGRIGVMICYDGHFPEVGRILALEGAEILFFPALQRGLTASRIELMVRSRAVDGCVYLVRSSYGHPPDVVWRPGMMAGGSCIVDFEGTILSDAGVRTGICALRIDLDLPRLRERSFGGEIGDPREFLRQDRRPETYRSLIRPKRFP